MYWDRTKDAFCIPYEDERKCNVVVIYFCEKFHQLNSIDTFTLRDYASGFTDLSRNVRSNP